MFSPKRLTALILYFILCGCMGRGNGTTKRAGPTATSTPLGKMKTDQKIIPPVPVVGSFLTGELLDKDGKPLVNAKVSIVGTQAAAPDSSTTGGSSFSLAGFLGLASIEIVYETMTNELGQFSIPVEKITSTQVTVKIQTATRLISSEIRLPPDVALMVNAARVSSGLPPLPDAPPIEDTQQTTGTADAGQLTDRKLGLLIPENRTAPLPDSNQTEPVEEIVSIITTSLPASRSEQGKTFSMWTQVGNESTATAARFFWKDAFSSIASVKIVFAKTPTALSQWDGRIENIPSWEGGEAGTNVIISFSQCTDTTYKSTGRNALTSADGKCGFARTLFPFNTGSDVYVRIVGESETAIKLSQVFLIAANNTAPEISAISAATVPEDGIFPLNVSLTDQDNPLICSAAMSVRSENTALLPEGNIYINSMTGGCKVFLVPIQNAYGTAKVTLSASDGSLTAQKLFTLTVTPVNDAPRITPIANQTIMLKTSVNALLFSINDVDNILSCSAPYVSATSSDAALVPVENITLSGTYPNCSVGLIPTQDTSGVTTVTLKVTDGLLTTERSFSLQVKSVNQAPTISAITSPQITDEDTPLTIQFVANDPDETLSCRGSSLIYASSNNSLIPQQGAVEWNGTWPNCAAKFHPLPDASGNSEITLVVSDGLLSTSRSFTLSVTSVNDAPTLSPIANQVTLPGVAINNIPFSVSDVDSTLTCSATHLSATSSNTELLPVENITFGGTAPSCTISMSPFPNLSGVTRVEVTLSDGDKSVTKAFSFTGQNQSGWYQEAYIKVANPTENSIFTVSMWQDTMAIGSFFEDSQANTVMSSNDAIFDKLKPDSGMVYIYQRSGDQWTPDAYLKATNSDPDDLFGYSVSLSSNTLAVSAYNENSSQSFITNGPIASSDTSLNYSGAVYIFRKGAQGWSQESYIKASNNSAYLSFGSIVSLSGETLAVGAAGDSTDGKVITNGPIAPSEGSLLSSGALYLYRRNGSAWHQEAYIKAVNALMNDFFGGALSLSGDTLAAGMSNDSSAQDFITNGNNASSNFTRYQSGAVYVYRRSGIQWQQEAYIKSSFPDENDLFGSAVSLSGNTLAVASQGEDSNSRTVINGAAASANNDLQDSGAVHVFRRTENTWEQEAFIKAANAGAGDQFGSSVSLSGDTLAVGSPFEDSSQTTITNGTDANQDDSSSNSGAVYVYRRSGTLWAQEGFLKASNSDPFDNFGLPVDLSGDTIAVASAFESSSQIFITNGSGSSADNSISGAGAVYVYRNTNRIFDPTVHVTSQDTNSITFTWSNTLGKATGVKIAPYSIDANPPPEFCPNGNFFPAGTQSYTFSGLTRN
ncbi:MAG: hypothetical protein RIR26_962, partial [Pseudomonadota bacterium]